MALLMIARQSRFGRTPSFMKKSFRNFQLGTELELNIEERTLHEIGHNMAFRHVHTINGDYEYNQWGLQSNISGQVVPSNENSINTINDAYNRSNMVIK